MIKAIELRKGRIVSYNDELWIVHDVNRTEHGNIRAQMQCKFKNIRTGRMSDFRIRVWEKIETPHVDDREYEFLYFDGQHLVLMDPQSFDQINVPLALNEEARRYLKGNERVKVIAVGEDIVGLELPNTVELEVTDTPPIVKGATVTNQSKDATLETGLKIRVPPFIENGEVLRVDTRTGEYIERAK
ncbi:MAG: elongation factor P [Phycisphaerae bacterium]